MLLCQRTTFQTVAVNYFLLLYQGTTLLPDDYSHGGSEAFTLSHNWSFDLLSRKWLSTSPRLSLDPRSSAHFVSTNNNNNNDKNSKNTSYSLRRTNTVAGYKAPNGFAPKCLAEDGTSATSGSSAELSDDFKALSCETAKNDRGRPDSFLLLRGARCSLPCNSSIPTNGSARPRDRFTFCDSAKTENSTNCANAKRAVGAKEWCERFTFSDNDKPVGLSGADEDSCIPMMTSQTEMRHTCNGNAKAEVNGQRSNAKLNCDITNTCRVSCDSINTVKLNGDVTNNAGINEDVVNGGRINSNVIINGGKNGDVTNDSDTSTGSERNVEIALLMRRKEGNGNREEGGEVNNVSREELKEGEGVEKGLSDDSQTVGGGEEKVEGRKQKRSSIYDNLSAEELDALTPDLQRELDQILSELYYNIDNLDDNLNSLTDQSGI